MPFELDERNSCNRTGAETHPWMFFLPPNICTAYPSSTNCGHSPRVFQPESAEHPNEQAQRELGWELARGLLILRHGVGHGVPRKTARILFWKLAWIWRVFLEPFFPCPKKSTPPKIPHLRKLCSQWFLWVLDPVCAAVFWMPVFLCLSTKTCKLTISVLGTSSGTTQRASIQ